MIREFRPTDAEPCARLIVEAFTVPPWRERWTVRTARALVDHIAGCPGFVGVVASDGTSLVGGALGVVIPLDLAPTYRLDEMFVRPARQRQGYGKALLDGLLLGLGERGIRTIHLVTARGTPAELFYRDAGFTVVEDRMVMLRAVPRIG